VKLCVELNVRSGKIWRPSDSPAVTGWWRADSKTTIATGVSAWGDLTTKGRNWSQATAGKQPALNLTGGPNSLPCLVGNGSTTTISVAFTLTLPWTMYLVWKWNAAFAAADEMVDSTTVTNIHAFRASGTTATLFATTGTIATPTNWHYYTISNTAGTSILKQDNVQKLTGAINGNSQPGLALFTAGDGTSNPANASLADMILVDGGAVSAADDAKIVKYIQRRYSL
jgi:hypothetical protein